MPAPNVFSGVALDRGTDGRRADAAWVEAQREGARVLVAGTAGVVARDGRLVLEARAPGPGAVLLGLDEAGPLWAEDEGPEHDPPAPPRRARLIGAGSRRGEPPPPSPDRLGLREAAGTLGAPEAGLAGYAASLLNWHRAHRFCANCGAPTEQAEAGFLRVCPRCRSQHHPRVDPVVIMLVEDGDRLLLGRQPSWPAGRYSCLAGFVSPGESLEEAVAREVWEEAGVRVEDPRYVSSQPWPFPGSLMLGFRARWSDGVPGGGTEELEDVGWFTRAQLAAEDGVLLPPPAAIARRLIDLWLEDDIK